MKRTTFLLAVILLPVLLAAIPGRKVKEEGYNLYKNTTLGMDGLRISKFEVSNEEYKEFLVALIDENKVDSIPVYAPDVEVWLRDLAFNDPYANYYFSHKAFRKYPVVGVTYEAAQAFCEWKTRRFGEMVLGRKDTAHFRFRLPTAEEWMQFAEAETPSRGFWPGGVAYPRSHKGDFEFNHKLGEGDYAGWAGGKGHDYEGYMITAPVSSFRNKNLNLCNMAGNVSEMVEEKGMAKGGSWAHLADQCRIKAVQQYDEPMAWLGFRYVVERIEK